MSHFVVIISPLKPVPVLTSLFLLTTLSLVTESLNLYWIWIISPLSSLNGIGLQVTVRKSLPLPPSLSTRRNSCPEFRIAKPVSRCVNGWIDKIEWDSCSRVQSWVCGYYMSNVKISCDSFSNPISQPLQVESCNLFKRCTVSLEADTLFLSIADCARGWWRWRSVLPCSQVVCSYHRRLRHVWGMSLNWHFWELEMPSPPWIRSTSWVGLKNKYICFHL